MQTTSSEVLLISWEPLAIPSPSTSRKEKDFFGTQPYLPFGKTSVINQILTFFSHEKTFGEITSIYMRLEATFS